MPFECNTFHCFLHTSNICDLFQHFDAQLFHFIMLNLKVCHFNDTILINFHKRLSIKPNQILDKQLYCQLKTVKYIYKFRSEISGTLKYCAKCALNQLRKVKSQQQNVLKYWVKCKSSKWLCIWHILLVQSYI